MSRSFVLGCTASLVLLAPACADRSSHDDTTATRDGGGVPTASASTAPPATGKVIAIHAISDEQGNRFEPNKVEVKRGDVLRITLVSGAHNLSFPAEKNPGITDLPAPSPVLQLPGQTYDLPITFGPGAYTFQCDPHAALGMVGELDVED